MLCTVSNDCHVNLFNMQDDCTPYFTLRGHQKPVYAVCTASITEHVADDLMSIDDKSKIGRLLFTAGMEGVIKIWMVPIFEKVDKFPLTDGRTYCVGEWSSEEASETGDEAYIKLAYHPQMN